jgi:hypothetical protein
MNFRPDGWKVFGGTVELENGAMQVSHVDVDVIVNDTTSRDEQNNEVPIYFTDLQFQPGAQKTGWIPNTQEMMDRIEFNVNEWKNYSLANGSPDTSYIWKTVSPASYTGQQLGYKRFFNLMGRGHEVITLPNDLPEEEFWRLDKLRSDLDGPVEILSTGIDFTLIPKDDFDLCRIATDVGSLLPEDDWNIPGDPTHPLNFRYTREFWFDGGKEGDILEVNATTMTARKNGAVIERNGIRQITIGSDTIEIYKNKFHLMPRGSVRFRIEFYKRDSSGILADTGIGFGGYAKFLQWTYGVERL